jgi:hypothetical protein
MMFFIFCFGVTSLVLALLYLLEKYDITVDYDPYDFRDFYSANESQCALEYNPGDIITLDLSKQKIKCQHRVGRAISTHGTIPVEPKENEPYIVSDVNYNGVIPNQKYRVTKTNKTFIYVFPKRVIDKYDRDCFSMEEGVFWYINYDDMTICQFEDGYPLFNIDRIIKIGEKNKYFDDKKMQ